MITLFKVLQRSPVLSERGLEVIAEGSSTVIIHRAGHARGLWRTSGDLFEYYPAGSNEAQHRVGTLEEVRAVTEQIFERRRQLRS
jgi:hypothetical protein